MSRVSKSIGSNKGFTIIEMIMVMVVVSIMAAIAIPQFINFRAEAKNAKTQAYLGAIRAGIANQTAQIALRCPTTTVTVPVRVDVNANSLGIGSCPEFAAILNANELKFITDTALPVNPWGTMADPDGGAALVAVTANNTVIACAAAGCTRANLAGCNNVQWLGGWCYNAATGDFWADSAGNPAANEATF